MEGGEEDRENSLATISSDKRSSLLINLVSVFWVKDEEMAPAIRGEHLYGTVSEQVATLVYLPNSVIPPLEAPAGESGRSHDSHMTQRVGRGGRSHDSHVTQS